MKKRLLVGIPLVAVFLFLALLAVGSATKQKFEDQLAQIDTARLELRDMFVIALDIPVWQLQPILTRTREITRELQGMRPVDEIRLLRDLYVDISEELEALYDEAYRYERLAAPDDNVERITQSGALAFQAFAKAQEQVDDGIITWGIRAVF